MRSLPELPNAVRVMLEGLDLTLHKCRTLEAAELVAERAYGLVLGIETVNGLPAQTIAALYQWLNATCDDVTAGLASG
jgi:hypothetical protein